MSSLQKFHRRTQSLGPASPFTTIGSGNNTVGYWLRGVAPTRLIVAPKSTEVQLTWGSYGIVRGTTIKTNGLSNTNTLYSFGSAAHPAAYHCKSLTTGGYNTWYMPALDEMQSCYTSRLAVPFATANGFIGNYYLTSTETTLHRVAACMFSNGTQNLLINKGNSDAIRAVRLSII
jgi:hypothetical protein